MKESMKLIVLGGETCLPTSQPTLSCCWGVLEIAGIAEAFMSTDFRRLHTQCSKPQRIQHVTQAGKG